ncbi:NAD(P)H-binding protein [Actinomycetospora sp. CA-084318]|uniref:NAD(P)H-binding protein n=1 Tax=Actinomycetospora sp. CA-084318 TaxID=3239892 RepID=UPI003D96D41A
MRLLIAGASGFVGHRLCEVLTDAGHAVSAMTRRPERYTGCGEPVRGDVHDPDSLPGALAGHDVAYYLVHSLDRADFVRADADGARAFGRAAAAAGVRRIVYLGGLGDDRDDLSDHLRSRREVETHLGEAGVPVTTIRAGIIVGHGGISWEMTRQLVSHLPAMVCPQWVYTRTQPIAIDDVVRYLTAVLDTDATTGRAFDVGGPDVLVYADMLQRAAAVMGRRRLVIVPVPLLTPSLSSRWLSLVTDVDTATGRSLIDSMSNEVVVRDDAIRRLVPFEPMPYDEAVRRALDDRAADSVPVPRRAAAA